MIYKTIDIERQSNGGISVVVNNGVPRGVDDSTNIIVKPYDNYAGCIMRSPSSDFYVRLNLKDSITINGTPAPTVLADLIYILLNWVVTGAQAYATPTKLAQTITFPALPTGLAHTAPAFNANATSSSGLACTYSSSNTAVATVNASTGLITPVGAGTCNITASQAGNNFYQNATPVVNPLTLT